jgi:hypothetical protein
MIGLVISTIAIIGTATAPQRHIKDCIIDGRETRCVIMNGPDGPVIVPYRTASERDRPARQTTYHCRERLGCDGR